MSTKAIMRFTGFDTHSDSPYHVRGNLEFLAFTAQDGDGVGADLPEILQSIGRLARQELRLIQDGETFIIMKSERSDDDV